MALTLLFLGWGFNAAWLSQPTPTTSQQAVFSLALILILVQAAQAGWLRHDDPWELKALRYLVEALTALVILAVMIAIGLVLILLASLFEDPVLRFLVPIIVLIVVTAILLTRSDRH
jgi:hypothetical protein